MKKLAMLPLLTLTILFAPLQAIAQQAQEPTTPPSYYGPGPWHMWAYGGARHFWLMLPMIILLSDRLQWRVGEREQHEPKRLSFMNVSFFSPHRRLGRGAAPSAT